MNSVVNLRKSALAEFARQPFQVYTEKQWDNSTPLNQLPDDIRQSMRAVAKVLQFSVNQYVIDNLIDWDQVL